MLDLRIGDGWVIEPGRYVVEVGRYAGDPSASRLHLDRR
jgi:hypothetical protein